jgi:hypothetical protein
MTVHDAGERGGVRTALLALTLGAGSLIAALAVTMEPPAAGPVAVLFPPWWDAARSMQAAATAGVIVRFGALPFVVVIMPDGSTPTGVLRAAGAWLILDPRGLGGCLVT